MNLACTFAVIFTSGGASAYSFNAWAGHWVGDLIRSGQLLRE